MVSLVSKKKRIEGSVAARDRRAANDAVVEFAWGAVNDAICDLTDTALGGMVVEVEVRLLSATAKRSSKQAEKAALLMLMAEHGKLVWGGADGQYLFDFGSGRFMRGNSELYFTAGEQLYLYRALVTKEDASKQRAALRSLRKRFGPGFLKGYV